MLESLSVKNFALIKEANIDFKNNLNVLTGETGSGKSILIGSINLALGKRASKEMLRNEDEDTIVSMCFVVSNSDTIEEIKEMDIPITDDGKIIIYRKITKEKNIAKINDEPCTLNKIKEVTEKLIDVYGQHDGEDLRKNAKHIEYLDQFIGNDAYFLKSKINKKYDELKNAIKDLEFFNLDENIRLRELDILKFEIEEIENAKIKENEESELSEVYKKYSNSKGIIKNLSNALNTLQEANISIALKEIKDAKKIDTSLENIYNSISDCDSIVNDIIKGIDKRLYDYDIDEKEFAEIENRLSLVRNIMSKYNNSYEVLMNKFNEKKERVEKLTNYEIEKENAEKKVELCKNNLYELCDKLTELRQTNSKLFIEKILFELKDLGFLDVNFDIDIKSKNEASRDGNDDVIFMISLNVGEKLRPLSDVASGGELSRIMLSIKTILSQNFGTDTLIFDEIDAGISGITASKVAVKLNKISNNHQVILITHLPQIASMADYHFNIKKEVLDNRTITVIEELDEKGQIEEIGRLISTSYELTDTVLANAVELKNSAKSYKTGV